MNQHKFSSCKPCSHYKETRKYTCESDLARASHSISGEGPVLLISIHGRLIFFCKIQLQIFLKYMK